MLYYFWDSLYSLILQHPSLRFLENLEYSSIKILCAFSLSLIISFCIAPRLIQYLKSKKIGQFIREEGPKSHYNKKGTPIMGGILIVVPTLITIFLIVPLKTSLLWIILIAFIGFAILGFVDDYLKLIKKKNSGLSVKQKFLGQIIISAIVATMIAHYLTTTFYIPFKWRPLLDFSYWYIPVGIFIIIAWSNAVNLTDGLDGLAGGLSAFLIIVIAFLSYLEGNSLTAAYFKMPFVQDANNIGIIAAAMLGSITVFLWYNFFPAQIFMGDTGSLALGAFIGTTSLILKKEIFIAIAGLIFIIEIFSVVLQVFYFKKTKKRLFKMAPLHHHFELSGIPESKIVIRFWLIGIFLVLIALGSLRIS